MDWTPIKVFVVSHVFTSYLDVIQAEKCGQVFTWIVARIQRLQGDLTGQDRSVNFIFNIREDVLRQGAFLEIAIPEG